MNQLGKLQEVEDIRSIWPDEARDFTPWLAEEENIAILSDEIGVDIAVSETESAVGDYAVDIFGVESESERNVIIENQLGKSDHSHLGKLLTYAAGKNAGIIVWVVRNACDEHRAAVQWLNNHTDEDIKFFLCEIKVYRIDGSAPAPKFKVIEAPNEWVRDNRPGADYSDSDMMRREYWDCFKEYVKTHFAQFMKQFKLPKSSGKHWMDFGIDSRHYHMVVCQNRRAAQVVVEFYINHDKKLFTQLLARKEAIEKAVGFQLDWRELPKRKASKIVICKDVDFDDAESRPAQFEWIAETMLKMVIPIKQHIAEIAREQCTETGSRAQPVPRRKNLRKKSGHVKDSVGKARV